MENTKSWYKSKTAWIAILQSVIGLLSGIILLLQQGLSTEAIAAFGVGFKGLLDLKLRFITSSPIQ